MDYSDNTQLIVLARNGDKAAKEKLVCQNGGLVCSIAKRFVGRGTDMQDLISIGNIGLLKAINSFDLSYNTAFSTYAVPIIMGEIRRFLRDDGLIKVSREAKRDFAILNHCKEAVISSKGCEPTVSELCKMCGISEENGIYALASGGAVLSLDTPPSDDAPSVADTFGEDKTDEVVELIALKDAVAKLPEHQQKLIALRFYKGLSQTQTAQVMGLTQVKVSRLEHRIFSALRESMT